MTNVQKKSRYIPGRMLLLLMIGFFSFFSSGAQNTKQLSGKVTNSVTNLPVAGASITVKGGTKGISTNTEGEFTLTIPATAKVLVVSSVGYSAVEVAIGTSATINVKLVAGSVDLNEVVVVGYGTQKKVTLAGSVATIDSKTFEDRVITSPIQAIQGATPGVVITNNSFQPGKEGWNFQIRGNTSINGSSALVVVDGIPLSDGGLINLINPNDIENITILKDAAASIYGSRAASGVLLLTTKKGKSGKPRVNYSSSYAAKKLGLTYNYANPKEWYQMYNEAALNNNNPNHSFKSLEGYFLAGIDTVSYPGIYGGYNNTYMYADYNKLLFHTANSQVQNVSVSGAAGKSNYNLSLGYTNDGSLLREGDNWNKKYNVRFNYETQVTEKLKVSTGIGLAYQNYVLPSSGDITNATGSVFNSFPGQAFTTRDGTRPNSWTNGIAPTWAAKLGGNDDTKIYRTDGQVRINYAFNNDFSFSGVGGIAYQTQKQQVWHNPVKSYSYDGTKQLNVTNNNIFDFAQNWGSTVYKNMEAQLDYKKTLGDHAITVMAGASYEKSTLNTLNASTEGGSLSTSLHSLDLGATSKGAYQIDDEWGLGAFFGRVTYAYKSKYIFEGIARQDGSSKFIAANRWKTFGSAMAAWRVSEEPFMKKLNVFNELKLRASYGTMGNQNGIGSYDYQQLININNGAYPFGNSIAGVTSLAQSANYANTVSLSRTWETIGTQNIGVDFAMLTSRFTGFFNYFIKNNHNMLVGVAYPAVYGTNPPYTNNGELTTKGWETQLTWADHIGDFRYSITGMWSNSKDKLLSLAGVKTYNMGNNNNLEGYAMNSIFGYQSLGIIRDKKTLDAYKASVTGGDVPGNISIGDMMYKDVDGDGKISQYGDGDTHKGDMVKLGDGSLHNVFSGRINLGWKNFDISALVVGVADNLIFRNYATYPEAFFWGSQTLSYYVGKTFNSTTNPNAAFPRLTLFSNGWNYQKSDFTMLNNRYARLKNLVLGYTIPENGLARIKFLSKARIYFSGENLLTINKIKDGWDPENGGMDGYPSYKTYVFGLNVTF